jgi:Tfp pilus assembly protein PilN
MIRVNLLANAPGVEPPRQWVPPEQKSAVMGLGMLLATALTLGGWWFYLSSARAEAESRIGVAEAKLEELKTAVKLLEQATQRKAELSERLTLIDRLKEAKRAPVSLLEVVSRSVPDGLWLVEIKQLGQVVQIEGRAMSLTSVTDFTETIQQSGHFKMPVEIVATTSEQIEETTVVRFSLKAEAAAAPAIPAEPAPGTKPRPASPAVTSPTSSGVPGV